VSAGHAHGRHASERALWFTLILTTLFLLVELGTGIWTHSLALISDAAHMFTDAAALAISVAAIRIARRDADARRTFGYHRFEILAATFNATLLLVVAAYILYEAWMRLQNPPAIASGPMLVVAIAGLVINLVSMRLLAGGKDKSLNVKGAYLEVWSDMLGSIGVIVGAVLIRWTGATWIDSAVAVAIGLWVVPRTWILLRSSLNVLLEGVPEGLDLADVERAIRGVPGVASVHDLHVWSITSGKASLTVHVVSGPDGEDWQALLQRVRACVAQRFGLHHSTVQIERTPCEQTHEADAAVFAPERHA
jgi:cobalt-zinc-cadmium efflux system protein